MIFPLKFWEQNDYGGALWSGVQRHLSDTSVLDKHEPPKRFLCRWQKQGISSPASGNPCLICLHPDYEEVTSRQLAQCGTGMPQGRTCESSYESSPSPRRRDLVRKGRREKCQWWFWLKADRLLWNNLSLHKSQPQGIDLSTLQMLLFLWKSNSDSYQLFKPLTCRGVLIYWNKLNSVSFFSWTPGTDVFLL